MGRSSLVVWFTVNQTTSDLLTCFIKLLFCIFVYYIIMYYLLLCTPVIPLSLVSLVFPRLTVNQTTRDLLLLLTSLDTCTVHHIPCILHVVCSCIYSFVFACFQLCKCSHGVYLASVIPRPEGKGGGCWE